MRKIVKLTKLNISTIRVTSIAIIATLISLLLGGCSPTNIQSMTPDGGNIGESGDLEDTGGDDSGNENPAIGKVYPISTLRSLYNGATNLITRDIVIEGRVVANDAMGEFPKSLILQDESGGVEIQCDIFRLYKRYPIGTYLRVTCSGLWLGSQGGCIYIGGDKSEDYIVERLSEEQISRHIRIDNTKYQQLSSMVVSYNDLSDNLLQRYIQMQNLRFKDVTEFTTFCEIDPLTNSPISTTHTLEDERGNTIELYVNKEAIYATMTVPLHNVNVKGILERYGTSYSLRIINSSIM